MTRFFIIIIYFTLSLHFTPGLQSAVCSLRFTLTAQITDFSTENSSQMIKLFTGHGESRTIEFGFEFEFELDFELDFELGFELEFELDFELDFELRFELEFELKLTIKINPSPPKKK